METRFEDRDDIVIKFAGDSGDGMQLTGNQFTNNSALAGNDIATFPDFPAEIRAPAGTMAGVSGFQLHFGSGEIDTPGDQCDVLVAMNAAALKMNLKFVKPKGLVIVDISGFDSKNMKLAGYEPGAVNPIENGLSEKYQVLKIDVSKLTKECLSDSGLDGKSIDRSKNMFVLGYIYWLYNRSMDSTIAFLNTRFESKPELKEANIKVLKAGYHFGDTTETTAVRYNVAPAKLEPGTYRNMMGNQATALGLIAASVKAGIPLFYGSYPITPASDILHELAKHKNFGVKTFQAEDEIAAVCSAIGASFGGALGTTGTSGPGLALKGEAISLALSLELPLVVINVQRAGPSTGMPTKTEQADLLMAMYGRHGESPLPIVAAQSPSDCFEMVYEAARIAIEHMTPVIFLSDGYIANGSEPWKFPSEKELRDITVKFAELTENKFQPYLRDEKLVRPWAVPGTKGLEHRIGGLEKEDITGNISYDPLNHEKMVKTRAAKVDKIADSLPELKIELGPESGKLLIIGWGSPHGSIRSAVKELNAEGVKVSQLHLRYLNPFQKELKDIIKRFDKVLVPEINNGQLVKILRDKFMIDAIGFGKMQGTPFTKNEIKDKVKELLGLKQ